MNLQLRSFFLAIILTVVGTFSSHSQKQVELLNRGLFALNKGDGTAYISWRLLVSDDNNVGFNLYRSTAGGAAIKLNSSVLTATTDYVDSSVDMSQSNAYYVVTVLNGAEQETSEIFTLPANPAVRQYMPIALEPVSGKNYTDYNVLHVYPGDIDGDGDYDYIVKRMPVDASYNTILLDCYDNDGVFKWRIDLGPNVDTYISTMTSPVLVADFDSDGKAEIIVKTGESTIFGNGYTIPDTDGDGVTDYNSHAGSGSYANVMAGPEFVSYVDGETGVEIDRGNFLSRRDPYSDWGDTYGARMNFMMSSVGYFDGVTPGVVFSRGDGADMDIDAWQIINGQLTQIWYYTARGKTYSVGGWTDFHQIQCIDVDGDGKDEISWGACMLDNDGSLLYTTKYVHGDRFQITDIDPNRPGLEVFVVQQYHPDKIGSALYDAATGETIKDWYVGSVSDIGRGDAGDIDPNSAGLELWDTGTASLHSATGSEVTGTSPYPWVGIWWDGDLLRENLIGVGSGGYNPAISKWNPNTGSEDRLFSTYNDDGAYSVTQPYGGRVPFVGDILGDWREEIVLESSDRTHLRVYTTKISAQNRLYTLMQNPSYRMGITTKAYLCTKYPDYFLGSGMSTPPKPNVTIVGEAGNIELQTTPADGSVTLDWTTSNVGTGIFEVLRDTDSDPAGRGRVSYAVNVNSYTDNTVTNGTTYYYWIKATETSGTTVTSNVSSVTPSGCVGTTITPYSQVDGGSWSQATEISVDAGGTVKFGPWPTSGGSWLWSGPNGFSATTREITISNISESTTGNYIATYTNVSGCESYQTFVISLNSVVVVPATIAKGGSGSSIQTVEVNTAIASFYYSYANATSATASGLPSGVSAALDTQAQTLSISGTPTVSGTYNYTVSTVGGDTNASLSGTITVTEVVQVNQEILWYTFDQSSGTSIPDATGSGNTGTAIGTTLFATGQVNNAINLDGNDGYVTVPSGVASTLNDFTIATWVYIDVVEMWSRIFDFGTGTSVYMFITPQANNGTVRFAISNGGGSAEQQINGSSALPAGTWTHVAVTLSGSTGTLYIDGVAVGSNSSMTLSPSDMGVTGNNYIGKSQYNDPYFDGQVDEFHLYNYALSASDVINLYDSENVQLPATLTKGGAGSSIQTVDVNTPIADFYYTWANATSATVAGLPTGVSTILNTTAQTISFSGSPTTIGTYNYTVTTVGGTTNASMYGTITVNAVVTESTITIQEDVDGFCSVDGTVDTNNEGYTGTGFANTANASGNGITWSIDVPSAGTYSFEWRYANGGSTDRTAQLMVDGSTVVSIVSMPSTGSWTSWATSGSTSVYLSAGSQLIRLQATNSSGLGNIDYVNVIGIDPQSVSCAGLKRAVTTQPEKLITNKAIYPNPFQSSININLPEVPETTFIIEIYNVVGKLVYSQTIVDTETTIELSNLESGVYLLKMNYNNELITEKLIKQ